jgi:hypothetical protein
MAFERPDGASADRRHHVRIWLTLDKGAEGRPIWLGSASFDRGVGVSHDTGQITHHIDPDLDKERDFVIDSLGAAGVLSQTYQVSGVGPTFDGHNGEGDRYFTDGEVTIGVVNVNALPTTAPPPMLPNPTVISAKQWVWGRFARLMEAIYPN